MSIESIFGHAVAKPSHTAVVHNGTAVSYAAFAGAIASTLGYLRTRDLAAGHTVIVVIHKLPDCWVAVFALHALGLKTVCMKSTELAAALALTRVAGVLTTEPEAAKHQLEADPRTGNRVITIPEIDYTPGILGPPPAIDGGGNPGGHILYTSGTTGTYKKLFWGIDLQQRRVEERIARNPCYKSDTIYHCANFGLWTGAGYKIPLTVWGGGGCVIFDQRPDWYNYFLHSEMTHTMVVPEQISVLLEHLGDKSAQVRDFTLMVSSGFISRNLAEQALQRITPHLENVYASTETNLPLLRSPVTDLEDLHWLCLSGDRRAEIVDEDGDACAVDVEGQLRIELSELDCRAYLDDPRATENAFRDGFFYPGDLAVKRADGRIRILGRCADVISFGGQKIAVAPIEDKIQTSLGVKTVCLFSGVSDSGEDAVVIAIESDHPPERADLMQLGHEFAQFDRVTFALLEQFPRTRTGTSKIDRLALRKLVFPR